MDNLLEPVRVKDGTSSTEQAALAGGECYMTRLELCCDLFNKTPSVVKGQAEQLLTLSFFNQSPDSELMNLLAKTRTDYTIKYQIFLQFVNQGGQN